MAITPHIRVKGAAATPNSSVLDPSTLNVYPPEIVTWDASETVSSHHGAASWRKLQFHWDFGEAGRPWRAELVSDFWFASRSRRYAYERIASHTFESYPASVGEVVQRTVTLTVSDVEHPEDLVTMSVTVNNQFQNLADNDSGQENVFVDPINGSDSYDGRASTLLGGSNGPKQTLAAALAQFSGGGSFRSRLLVVGNGVTLPITPTAWPTSIGTGWMYVRPLNPAHAFTIQADASGDLVRANGYNRLAILNATLLGFSGGSFGVLASRQMSLVGCELTNWLYGMSQGGVRRDDIGMADCHFHDNNNYNVYLGDDAADLKQRAALDGCVLEEVGGEHSIRGTLHRSALQNTRIIGRKVGKVTVKYHGGPAGIGGSQDGVISGCDLVGEEDVAGTVVCVALTNTGGGGEEEIHRTTIGQCLIRTPNLTGAKRGIEIKLSDGVHLHDTVLHGWSEAIERGGADGSQGIQHVTARNVVHYTARATGSDVRFFSTGTSDSLAWGAGNLDVRNCHMYAPNATGNVYFIAGSDADPANVVAERNSANIIGTTRIRLGGVNYRWDATPTVWPGLAGNTNANAHLGMINPADYTDDEAFKVAAATTGELTENRYDYYGNQRVGANWIGVYQRLVSLITPPAAILRLAPRAPGIRAVAMPSPAALRITPGDALVRAVVRPSAGLVRIRPMAPAVGSVSSFSEEYEMISWAMSLLADAIDVSIPVRLLDASGAPLPAVGHGAVLAWYWRMGEDLVSIPAVALAALNAAHTDGGWREVSAANMPGDYRLDLPDAVVADGSPWASIAVKTATSRVFRLNIELAASRALRDVRQRSVGHVAIDHATKLLTVFEEDGTTPRITLLNRQHPTTPTVQEMVPQ